MTRLKSVDYEVAGRVQGVFFRKYTQQEAQRLKLVGWVANTDSGTVRGQIQGEIDKIEEMKTWLRTKGSPHSHVTEARFTNEKDLDKPQFDSFSVRHM